MASDETRTFNSSMKDEDFDEDIIDDGFDHHLQHQHSHNLSRLSVCTSSTLCGVDDDVDEDDDVDNVMTTYLSRLSIESSFGDGDGEDADGELSDGKEEGLLLSSDDSEKLVEVGSCYSLPATPPRRRNRVGVIGEKDYASENEAQKGKGKSKTERNDERRRRRNRRVKRMFDRYSWETMKKKEDHAGWFSGESDQSGCTGTGTGVVVITRPKGGKRSLCMGLEEVKACRDLGFELEHERMMEIPSSSSRLSLETISSGGNSPIANWRISSPGDDPRDVKARIKVWAQAVALASASKYTT